MKKLALIVGINYPDTEFSLRGCINDTKAILQKLVMEFNFNTKDIQILIDQVATKKNILDGIDRLVTELSNGDVGVFYYAGHGTQTVDLPPIDEEDMFDEAIVPYDAIKVITGGDDEIVAEKLIRDDEIYERIAKLSSKDMHFVTIFDSCHSYTGTHESTKARAIPTPIYINKISEMIRDLPINFISRGLHPVENMNHLLLAGCKADQSSFDDGTNGFFTSELIKELKFGRTYRELHDLVVPKVIERSKGAQEPQFEGPFLDKKIFEF